MLNQETRDKMDAKTLRRMNWYLFIGGAIRFTSLLIPWSSSQWTWYFTGGTSHIKYIEYYIFGVRVARRRV